MRLLVFAALAAAISANAAQTKWPQQGRDALVAQCAINFGDIDDSAEKKAAVTAVCQCVAENVTSKVSYSDFQKAGADTNNADATSEVFKTFSSIVDTCSAPLKNY